MQGARGEPRGDPLFPSRRGAHPLFDVSSRAMSWEFPGVKWIEMVQQWDLMEFVHHVLLGAGKQRFVCDLVGGCLGKPVFHNTWILLFLLRILKALHFLKIL